MQFSGIMLPIMIKHEGALIAGLNTRTHQYNSAIAHSVQEGQARKAQQIRSAGAGGRYKRLAAQLGRGLLHGLRSCMLGSNGLCRTLVMPGIALSGFDVLSSFLPPSVADLRGAHPVLLGGVGEAEICSELQASQKVVGVSDL